MSRLHTKDLLEIKSLHRKRYRTQSLVIKKLKVDSNLTKDLFL